MYLAKGGKDVPFQNSLGEDNSERQLPSNWMTEVSGVDIPVQPKVTEDVVTSSCAHTKVEEDQS